MMTLSSTSALFVSASVIFSTVPFVLVVLSVPATSWRAASTATCTHNIHIGMGPLLARSYNENFPTVLRGSVLNTPGHSPRPGGFHWLSSSIAHLRLLWGSVLNTPGHSPRPGGFHWLSSSIAYLTMGERAEHSRSLLETGRFSLVLLQYRPSYYGGAC